MRSRCVAEGPEKIWDSVGGVADIVDLVEGFVNVAPRCGCRAGGPHCRLPSCLPPDEIFCVRVTARRKHRNTTEIFHFKICG